MYCLSQKYKIIHMQLKYVGVYKLSYHQVIL